jgi:hypothetical protein
MIAREVEDWALGLWPWVVRFAPAKDQRPKTTVPKKRSPGLIRILAQPRQPRAYRTEPRDYVSGCKLDKLQPISIYQFLFRLPA